MSLRAGCYLTKPSSLLCLSIWCGNLHKGFDSKFNLMAGKGCQTSRKSSSHAWQTEGLKRESHLWLPSNFWGKRTLLTWPKGWKSARTSFALASNATFLTTTLVALASFLFSPSFASFFGSKPFFILSWSSSLCPSSTEACDLSTILSLAKIHPSHMTKAFIIIRNISKHEKFCNIPTPLLAQVWIWSLPLQGTGQWLFIFCLKEDAYLEFLDGQFCHSFRVALNKAIACRDHPPLLVFMLRNLGCPDTPSWGWNSCIKMLQQSFIGGGPG